ERAVPIPHLGPDQAEYVLWHLETLIASHLPADAARRRQLPRRVENRQEWKSLGAKPIEFCACFVRANTANAVHRRIRQVQYSTLLHPSARFLLAMQIGTAS